MEELEGEQQEQLEQMVRVCQYPIIILLTDYSLLVVLPKATNLYLLSWHSNCQLMKQPI